MNTPSGTRSHSLRACARLTVLVALGASLLGAFSCESRVSPPLLPDEVSWSTYTSAELGFSIRHPDLWTPRFERGSVIFQDAVATPMRITLVEPEGARKRGLWGRDPAVRQETKGAVYRYLHYDGPFYVPTLAFVVPHRGRDLGVELRTRNQDLDEVQRAVVDSLELR